MLRRIVAFVVAAIVMVVLGSAAHSVFIQYAWSVTAGQAEGIDAIAIPMGERVSWVVHDVVGMETNFPPYGAFTTVALLIAFLVAGLVARFTGLRTIVFAATGAATIFALFTAIKMNLGTVVVFGARGTMGLSAQMLAGVLAGVLFAILTRPRSG